MTFDVIFPHFRACHPHVRYLLTPSPRHNPAVAFRILNNNIRLDVALKRFWELACHNPDDLVIKGSWKTQVLQLRKNIGILKRKR
jgi:hypothetical protein